MLSFVAQAGAQETAAVIVGAVVDSVSGIPVSQVGVYLDGNHLVTQSDAGGEFGVIGMPAGSHTLHLIKSNCTPQTVLST